MLQEAAVVGVVVFHAGRGTAEFLHERFVHQVRFAQRREVGRFDAAEDFGQPGGHFVDLGRLQHHEVFFMHFVGPGLANVGGDHLHRPLEELRAPLDQHVIAVLEGAVVSFAGVP